MEDFFQEFPMKCDRCGSAMIQETFYGPHEHFLGWRCIYCGEIIDYLILENRRSLSRIAKERQEMEKMNTRLLRRLS
jgi:hypothetical protein